ncbi:MAG: RNA polymerase-binding protein DksA [Xanthomonadales bacterium]|nr:RNA polymerase-binding protein DksA [Xanthomonadales bacterium]
MAKNAASKKKSAPKAGKPAQKSKAAAKAKPKAVAKPKPATKAKPAAKAKPATRQKPAKPAPRKPAPAKGKAAAPARKPAPVKAKVAPKKPTKPAPKAKPVAPAKPAPQAKAKAAAPAAVPKAAPKAPSKASQKQVFPARPVYVSPPPSPRPTGPKAVALPTSKPKPVQRPLRKHSAAGKKPGDAPRIELPPGYVLSSKDPYMGSLHLEYFRRKLSQWRVDLVEESKQTIDNLRDEVRDVGDEAERATRETENSLELRTRDRYRKLINKIDKALKRIEDGEYGYCEETGEEIGLERLEARPIATLCLDAQERWEHRQKQMGD